MYSIVFPASVSGNSSVFNAVHHCTVVGIIIFDFP